MKVKTGLFAINGDPMSLNMLYSIPSTSMKDRYILTGGEMSLECKVDFSPATKEVTKILHGAKSVAVVGISSREDAPSHDVAKYLIKKGFRVIGVNPKCEEVLGVKCYPDLKSIPEPVDVVDIFRRLDAIPGVVDEAIEIRAGAVWMQQGLEHEASAQKARRAGLGVVMNKCMKIEHSRIYGC